MAFIDAEHALDPDYAKALGVDTDALLVSQPDSGEQALEIADMLIRSGALDLIVIDSVAALVPRAEIEGEMGDSHVGLQARLMSQALRKMTGALNNAGTTAIFINQLREKIGVMFGSPETTTGGRALKFYSSVRLDVRRIETLKDGQEMVGNRTRVKVVKNKVAPPFKQAEFDIMYGQGISREGGLIDVGVEAGLVRKAGAWYTYEGDQLGQGKENARNFLRDNPDLANELEKRILEKLGVGPQVDAEARGPAEPTASTSERSVTARPDAAVRSRSQGCGGRFARPGRRAGDRAWAGVDASDAAPPAGGPGPARARGRPRGGGAQDPARPADRPGAQPLRAGDQAGRASGCPTEVAERLLDRFEEVGLVDDAAFARDWVAVPAARQGAGAPGAGPGAAPQGDRRRGRRARPSTRSTPTTRSRPPGPLVRRKLRSLAAGRPDHRGAPADRDAGPQGLPAPAWRSGWCARSSAAAGASPDESAEASTARVGATSAFDRFLDRPRTAT